MEARTIEGLVGQRRKIKIIIPHRFSNDVPSAASDHLTAAPFDLRKRYGKLDTRSWRLLAPA